MKNLLIPTDFSNNAYNALFHATKLMEGQACTFLILNVYNSFTPLRNPISSSDISQHLEDESLEGLQSVSHRIRTDDGDSKHTFKTLSKRGNLLDIVSKIVESEEIDLIVMGNSGRSEIEAIFMGSNALDLTTKVEKCPILTIPKEIDFIPPKQIAFVTDYGRAYDAGLLQPLLFLAERYKSKIAVMHINEEEILDKHQTINKGILMEYLSKLESNFYWMPLFKSKATAINTFLEELEIDMLAMVNYEHSFLERMTREPIIKRVGFDNNIPFLVIPYNT